MQPGDALKALRQPGSGQSSAAVCLYLAVVVVLGQRRGASVSAGPFPLAALPNRTCEQLAPLIERIENNPALTVVVFRSETDLGAAIAKLRPIVRN